MSQKNSASSSPQRLSPKKNWSSWQWAIVFFCVWRAMTVIFAWLAQPFLPLVLQFTPAHDVHFARSLPYFVWMWGNFDGTHYMDIAYRGYRAMEQGFFPLYPILMRGVVELLHVRYVLAGELISNLAFLVSVFLFMELLKLDQPQWPTNTKILFLTGVILFPTTFFYGAVYNDALFLLLATLSIVTARERRWVRSSWWAALAMLARLNGVALFGFILIEWAQRRCSNAEETWEVKKWPGQIAQFFHPREWWKTGIWSVGLIPLVFLGYLTYIQLAFGSWRMLFHSMEVWKQSSVTFPPQVIWRYLKIFLYTPINTLNFWVAALEFGAVFGYLYLLTTSFRKIRFSYWMLFAVSILIPWLTGTFQGMPRYGLHLYPMFLALTMMLEEESKIFRVVTLVVLAMIQFGCLALFTRGYFVA